MSNEDDYSETRNEKPVDSTVPPALPTAPASNLSTLPVSTVPMTTVPVTTVPASTVPASTVPATTVPVNTVPGTTVPVSTVPATTVPATTVPVQYRKLGRLEEQAHLEEEISLVKETKVICSLDILLELFKYCRHPGCVNEASFKHHTIGPTLIVNWNCPSGHQGRFSSSKDVNAMYANNLQVAAAILLSGNSFFKIEKMARFMGLSLFFRMQRLYLIPVVNEWWSWQREQILKEFFDKEVIVCGDGQCDSPGHTAKNLCYFLMELVSGYILEVEVNDKRHVNLVSVNMEKNALRSALQRLRGILNVVEIVTDASSTIKKLIGKILQAIIKQVYQYCFTDTLEFCSLF